MNWLFFIVLVFFAWTAFKGFRRGFVRTLIGMTFLILTIAATVFFTPKMNTLLSGSESVTAWAQSVSQSYIDKKAAESANGNTADSFAWLAILPLPDKVKESLENGNTEILRILLQSGTVRTYLAEKAAAAVVALVAAGITLLLAIVVLAVLSHLLNKAVNAVPAIGAVNRILGFFLGAVKALLLIWIFFILVSLFKSTQAGAVCMKQIEESRLLKLLYEQNVLLKIVPDLLTKII